ncbi:DHA2 family multidrug resistance protein [Neorhizobium sp. JUb45]|nr:DHA2 family multidrug resistance protein [Neorhizobium sp. JUb45]
MVVPALLYAFVSAIIPFTHTFDVLFALHVVHGALLGLFVPATLMIIFRNLPIKWWVTAIALYAFRTAFTQNSGTALLDFYVQHLGWQFLYWQDVALAPVMGMLAFFGAPREEVNRDLLHHADWGGMILFGTSITMVFVAVDQGNRLDWFENGFVVSTLLAGMTLFVAFLINEKLAERPWASIGAIGGRNLVLMLTVGMFYMMAALSNTMLTTNYLTTVTQLRPEQIGTTLIQWVCIPLVIMCPFAIWAMHRIDGRIVLMIGLSCFAVSAIIGTSLTSQWNGDSFRTMFVLQGAGHILTFLPVIVVSIAHGDPKKAIAVGAYIQVLRLLGQEVAQALMTTYLRKQEQLHSYLLGLNVEGSSQNVASAISTVRHSLAAAGMTNSQPRATSIISQLVQRQASVLSLIDAFWLTFFCSLGALVVMAFVQRAPRGPLSA